MDTSLILQLGKLFPVINGGLIVGLIALYLKNRLETRKQVADENSGLREDLFNEMGVLRKELRDMRDENGTLRDEVRDLRAENGNLRTEVRQLHSVIDGLRRETHGASISAQRIVAQAIADGSPGISPEVQSALDSLDRIRPTVPPVVGSKSEVGQ